MRGFRVTSGRRTSPRNARPRKWIIGAEPTSEGHHLVILTLQQITMNLQESHVYVPQELPIKHLLCRVSSYVYDVISIGFI